MSLLPKILTALGLVTLLTGASLTDMFMTRDTPLPTDAEGTEQSSSIVTEPTEHVPDVMETLALQRLEFQQPSEQYFIQTIVNPGEELGARVLLKDNDRIGLIAWVRSPLSKVYFRALKEALHESFSPDVTELVDEVQENPDRPKRSMLTFKDPALSQERLVFILVRDHLFEFHISEGKDEEIFALIEALTK